MGSIVEISGAKTRVSANKGFLVLTPPSGDRTTIPLDLIAAVVAVAPDTQWTQHALVCLSEYGAPVVFCDRFFQPRSSLWPVGAHHRQTAIHRAQAALTLPRAKNIWRTIVRAKIQAQENALAAVSIKAPFLEGLRKRVRSGDPDNVEALAALRYWKAMMGRDFKRDREAPGPNALLNYGYAILRAATIRALLAAGLHPSFSVHHRNIANALVLADDLMEPFRPAVDVVVHRLKTSQPTTSLNPAVKRQLVAVLHVRWAATTGAPAFTLSSHILAVAQALAAHFLGENKVFSSPVPAVSSLRQLHQPTA